MIITTDTDNTTWETLDIFISEAEYFLIKSMFRVNPPLEFLGCTKPPIYHSERFHMYRNCPKKTDLDVTEYENRSIWEYSQHNSVMGEIMVTRGSQGEWGNIASMYMLSVYNYNRYDVTQYCKKEGFGYLYQEMLMCKMVDQFTSKQ